MHICRLIRALTVPICYKGFFSHIEHLLIFTVSSIYIHSSVPLGHLLKLSSTGEIYMIQYYTGTFDLQLNLRLLDSFSREINLT